MSTQRSASRVRSTYEFIKARYVYDELGRLVAVIDSSGQSAVYTYDAVGNLLSIARYASGAVTVIEFTPNGGPAGTVVNIQIDIWWDGVPGSTITLPRIPVPLYPWKK